MSPASAFAIATAAAGHSTSQGRERKTMKVKKIHALEKVKLKVGLIVFFFFFSSLLGFSNTEKACDKEFIIRRAATNRVLNVLRHWVSKHSQVSQQQVKP